MYACKFQKECAFIETYASFLGHFKAILKKMSVGGNISGKKTTGRKGIFIFFKEHFQISCERSSNV